MTDKPSYPRNCVFNQCIQPQICDASNACIWNASNVPMIEGSVTGIRVMKDGTTIAGNLAPDAPKDQRVTIPAEQMKQFARVRAALYDDKPPHVRSPLDDMPKLVPTRIAYIVWNAARTEGYITFDQQVAYEARKGAESNCFDANGTQMKLAQAFCEVYSSTDDAIRQIVVISEPPAYPGD